MQTQQIEPQSNHEQFRHQCEVRYAIKQGRDWFERYLTGVAKARGKHAATRLLADVKDQARKGNTGEAGSWMR